MVASTPYAVSIFTTSIPGVDFAPDSIAVLNGHVFVGYGDGAAPDGSDGKSSTIVEYKLNGDRVTTCSVPGHNDGLRVNPSTKQLWAMQNEDGNPNLVIIDPSTRSQTMYTFGPTPHGGGYDDIAFRGNDVFLSASNPANSLNSAPAIVKARIRGNTVVVTPVLSGTATVQADSELIVVHRPGHRDQTACHLPITRNASPVQIDDAVFATASHGMILVSDRDGETVYAITRNIFSPGAAYSATPSSVAALDPDTGVLTEVVTGMVSPHGMAFVSAREEE